MAEIVTTWSPSGDEVRTAPQAGESMGSWMQRHLDAVEAAAGQSNDTLIETSWPTTGAQTHHVETPRATDGGDPPVYEVGIAWRGTHYRGVAAGVADHPPVRGG